MDAIPNRDLDRMLAEKIGWLNIEPVSYWEDNYYDTYEVHTLRGQPPGSKSNDVLLPSFSTDLNDALRLVDHVQPIHFTLSYSPDRMNWRAEFDDLAHTVFADALNPAAAICLAYIDWLATKR